MVKITLISDITDKEETWELCEKTFFYCPRHGKSPAILNFKLPNGDEMVKQLIIEPLFYCQKCGMVKMINVWNNCSGLCKATMEKGGKI